MTDITEMVIAGKDDRWRYFCLFADFFDERGAIRDPHLEPVKGASPDGIATKL